MKTPVKINVDSTLYYTIVLYAINLWQFVAMEIADV